MMSDDAKWDLLREMQMAPHEALAIEKLMTAVTVEFNRSRRLEGMVPLTSLLPESSRTMQPDRLAEEKRHNIEWLRALLSKQWRLERGGIVFGFTLVNGYTLVDGKSLRYQVDPKVVALFNDPREA